MTVQAIELEGIDRTREAHVAALNAGEADARVACFEADAVQMPPNYPPNVGAESIRAWSDGLLAPFQPEFSLLPDEVQLTGGDWAFERGTYTISLAPRAGGDPLQDVGKYTRFIDGKPTTRGSWPATSGAATTHPPFVSTAS